MKTIAVDLDDTLNNFTETLQKAEFEHDGTHSLTREAFEGYVRRVRGGSREESELLSTEFSFFKNKIHRACYDLATARADGVEFMRWLRQNQWRIVICTYRDLRRSNASTRRWLSENGIPFDHLFMAWNKIVFCKAWGIEHLVDDHIFNITHGGKYGLNVYYPHREGLEGIEGSGAKAFRSFEEVRTWIQESR
jgi:5'(3')-deoxyribonucleotidase